MSWWTSATSLKITRDMKLNAFRSSSKNKIKWMSRNKRDRWSSIQLHQQTHLPRRKNHRYTATESFSLLPRLKLPKRIFDESRMKSVLLGSEDLSFDPCCPILAVYCVLVLRSSTMFSHYNPKVESSVFPVDESTTGLACAFIPSHLLANRAWESFRCGHRRRSQAGIYNRHLPDESWPSIDCRRVVCLRALISQSCRSTTYAYD